MWLKPLLAKCTFNNFWSASKLYFTRHPIIGGFVFVYGSWGLWEIWYLSTKADSFWDSVRKYRQHYIVYRPTDKAARIIKHEEIPLDR